MGPPRHPGRTRRAQRQKPAQTLDDKPEYQERDRNTIIRRPDGRDLPAHGRFWINPSDGAVLISELIVDGGGVIATVTVSYQSEPLMGFLVPIEMRESYVRSGERISGHAVYSKFRPIRK